MIRLRIGCKINLGLKILGLRDDGYHSLESIFYPLPYPCDDLLLEPGAVSGLSLNCAISGENNILHKAHQAFKKATGHNPGIRATLIKRIPIGAGLGGGSANAAAYLNFLNEYCGEPLKRTELVNLAAAIGADVPFFLFGGPCFVAGKGEIITPIALSAFGWHLVAVYPQILISTPEAFAAWDKINADCLTTVRGCDKNPISNGHDVMVVELATLKICNDLEKPVQLAYPVLGTIRESFLALGAEKAAMSGSGSTMFGLFSKRALAEKAAHKLRQIWRLVYHLSMRSFGM